MNENEKALVGFFGLVLILTIIYLSTILILTL
jgi:hypothetical protein